MKNDNKHHLISLSSAGIKSGVLLNMRDVHTREGSVLTLNKNKPTKLQGHVVVKWFRKCIAMTGFEKTPRKMTLSRHYEWNLKI